MIPVLPVSETSETPPMMVNVQSAVVRSPPAANGSAPRMQMHPSLKTTGPQQARQGSAGRTQQGMYNTRVPAPSPPARQRPSATELPGYGASRTLQIHPTEGIAREIWNPQTSQFRRSGIRMDSQPATPSWQILRSEVPGVSLVAKPWVAPASNSPETATVMVAPLVTNFTRSLPVPSRAYVQSSEALQVSYVTPPSVPPVSEFPSPEESDLREGAEVMVSGCSCRITAPLGMGSYGMVWSAVRQDREVALKEILCPTEMDLTNAKFEGDLLAKLTESWRGEDVSADELRIPWLVDRETELLGEAWRVRLVMTRVPGIPLVIFLEQRRPQPQIELCSDWSFLAEPCQFSADLVSQLGPTLDRIASVAFHRDVNPRNVLVDLSDPTRPQYGLVDFGMAVDAVSWCSDGEGSWDRLEVGGDCRYWPLSAWTIFLDGPDCLLDESYLLLEYQTLLDVHATGIMSLQVFIEMCPSSFEIDGALARSLEALQTAWARYWNHMMTKWKLLLQCFSGGGDWDALKNDCIEQRITEVIDENLSLLREGLADVANAAAELGLEKEHDLFATLRLMISCSTVTEAVNWTMIRKSLGEGGPVPFAQA